MPHDMAAHDLNYQAETGLMALTAGSDGAPGLPNVLAADLVGGAYPAIMMSSFSPIKTLKSNIGQGKENIILRKGLVVFQFTISIG